MSTHTRKFWTFFLLSTSLLPTAALASLDGAWGGKVLYTQSDEEAETDVVRITLKTAGEELRFTENFFSEHHEFELRGEALLRNGKLVGHYTNEEFYVEFPTKTCTQIYRLRADGAYVDHFKCPDQGFDLVEGTLAYE